MVLFSILFVKLNIYCNVITAVKQLNPYAISKHPIQTWLLSPFLATQLKISYWVIEMIISSRAVFDK